MGIIIDVSHLNDPGFWDVVKYSKSPLIATHSNCRALVDHPRNLTDDQIVAIANTGGVIGVNACRLFVGNGGLERFVDHIDHLVRVGGIEHVGLGPDFADYLVQYLGPANRAKFSKEDILPVDGFAGEEDYPRLSEALESRGYFAKDIDRIMGENFVRLFKELLK